MIASMLLAACSSMVLLCLPPQTPMLRKVDGQWIVDTPGERGNRRVEVRMDLSKSMGMTLAEQFERILAPEPYTIIASDEKAGTATLATSEWGAWKLTTNNHHWSSIKVAATTPPVERIETRNCYHVLASLDLDPSDSQQARPAKAYEAKACPPAEILDPLEHVLLEGVTAYGRRLWVTRAPDSRFTRGESIGAAGQLQTSFAGRVEAPLLTAAFVAPITGNLARIRWYQLTEDGSLKKIGETDWRPFS